MKPGMAKSKTAFRIGTGAGFSADRLAPAVDLAQRGNLDVTYVEEQHLGLDLRIMIRTVPALFTKGSTS